MPFRYACTLCDLKLTTRSMSKLTRLPHEAVTISKGHVVCRNMAVATDFILRRAQVVAYIKEKGLPVEVFVEFPDKVRAGSEAVAKHWVLRVQPTSSQSFRAWFDQFLNQIKKDKLRKRDDPERTGAVTFLKGIWVNKAKDKDVDLKQMDESDWPDGMDDIKTNSNVIIGEESLDASGTELSAERQFKQIMAKDKVCPVCWKCSSTHVGTRELLYDERTNKIAQLAVKLSRDAKQCAEVAKWLCSYTAFKIVRLLHSRPESYLLFHLFSVVSLFRMKPKVHDAVLDCLQPCSGRDAMHVFIRDLDGRPPDLGPTVVSFHTFQHLDEKALTKLVSALVSNTARDSKEFVKRLAVVMMMNVRKSVGQHSALPVDMVNADVNDVFADDCSVRPPEPEHSFLDFFMKQRKGAGKKEKKKKTVHPVVAFMNNVYMRPCVVKPQETVQLSPLTYPGKEQMTANVRELFRVAGITDITAEGVKGFSGCYQNLSKVLFRQYALLPVSPIAIDASREYLPSFNAVSVMCRNAGILTTLNSMSRSLELAEMLLARAARPDTMREYVVTDDPSMTQSQMKLARLIQTKFVGVVDGPAGTGKTFGVVKALSQARNCDIMVIGVSHNASTNIYNALTATSRPDENKVTIHRRVGAWLMKTGDLSSMEVADIVIADESSMNSEAMMLKLLLTVKDDAVLLFVGDPAQKAPISNGGVAGMPFRDFVRAAEAQIGPNGIPRVKMMPVNLRTTNGAAIMARNFGHLRDAIMTPPTKRSIPLHVLWDFSAASGCSFVRVEKPLAVTAVWARYCADKEREEYAPAVFPTETDDVVNWALNSVSANTLVIAETNEYLKAINSSMFIQNCNVHPSSRKLKRPFDIFTPGTRLRIDGDGMWFISLDEHGEGLEVIEEDGTIKKKRKTKYFPLRTRLIVVGQPRIRQFNVMVNVIVEGGMYEMGVRRSALENREEPVFSLAWAIGATQAQGISVGHVIFLPANSVYSPMNVSARGHYSAITRARSGVVIVALRMKKSRRGRDRGYAWANFEKYIEDIGMRSAHDPQTVLSGLLSPQMVKVGLGSQVMMKRIYISAVNLHLKLGYYNGRNLHNIPVMGANIVRICCSYLFGIPVTEAWTGKWEHVNGDVEVDNDGQYASVNHYREIMNLTQDALASLEAEEEKASPQEVEFIPSLEEQRRISSLFKRKRTPVIDADVQLKIDEAQKRARVMCKPIVSTDAADLPDLPSTKPRQQKRKRQAIKEQENQGALDFGAFFKNNLKRRAVG